MPNVIHVNRGKLSLDGVAEKALEIHADCIVIIDRWKDGFANIKFFQLGASGLAPVPPQINIASVRLRREFEKAGNKRIKSLAITIPSENSLIARRLATATGNFFNIPIFVGQDKISNFSAVMHISSNALNRVQITFLLLPSLVEAGPRINVSKVVWDELK
jgi:rRNA maturation protein Rpf1